MNKETNIEKEETYEELLKNMMNEHDIDITKYSKTMKNDLVFKIFFSRKGNEKFLISFLESILNIKIKNVEIIPEASLGFTKLDDKWSRIDIKATVDNNKVINIEMQLEPDLEIARRSTYYGGWLIANQLGPGKNYTELKEVILINILNFNLFETPSYHKETITVEKNNREYELIPFIKYHFIELPKFRKNVQKINSKLEAWLAIIDCKDWGLIQMAKEVDEIFIEAIMEIEAILNNKELRYIIDKRYESMREKASKLAYAEEKGANKEKLKIAKEMLKNKVDIEIIEKTTGLSKETIEKL